MMEMFVEFTLAVNEAKSDRKVKGCELRHCRSKDLEEEGYKKWKIWQHIPEPSGSKKVEA